MAGKRGVLILSGVISMWLMSSISIAAAAEVKCFPEAIKSIQIAQGGDLFYTTKSGVRRKLTHFSQAEAMAMFELMRASIGTHQIIQVVYPEGYNCKAPDLDVHADALMMQDPEVR